jgi:hypothetical protein
LAAGGAFEAGPAAVLGDAFAEASAVFVSAGLPVDALDEDAALADEAVLSAEAVDALTPGAGVCGGFTSVALRSSVA